MAFVPPVHAYGSPTALDLGQRLANVVQEYRQTHPGTTEEDVRQAFRVAALGGGSGSGRRLTALTIGLIAAAVALMVPLLMRHGVGRPGAGPWLPFAMIVGIAVVFAVLRGARR